MISNIDIRKLKKENSIAAILLKTKFGIIGIKNDKYQNLVRKKRLTDNWMNAGLYHLTKNLVKDLPKKEYRKNHLSKICKKRKIKSK